MIKVVSNDDERRKSDDILTDLAETLEGVKTALEKLAAEHARVAHVLEIMVRHGAGEREVERNESPPARTDPATHLSGGRRVTVVTGIRLIDPYAEDATVDPDERWSVRRFGADDPLKKDLLSYEAAYAWWVDHHGDEPEEDFEFTRYSRRSGPGNPKSTITRTNRKGDQMRRIEQRACDTVNGQLIIDKDGSRMRVQSVRPTGDGRMIISGSTATGIRGTAYDPETYVTRLE